MKTPVLYICLIALAFPILFSSCSQDENALTNDEIYAISQKYIPAPIELPTNSLEWDVSYHPYDKPETRAASNNQSHEMAVTIAGLYPAAVYSAKSVNDLTFTFIPNQVDPIDISYNFPRYYFDYIERSRFSTYMASLQSAIESPQFTGKQLLSFEYDFREFSYYRELKLAFGANIDVASIFKMDASYNQTKINATSGLFARVVQKNFACIMDYPWDGNVFLNDGDLTTLLPQEPVYINSIIYGRMAIMAMESSYSYNELKTAFNASLNAGIINGELNISVEHKKILQSAEMKILVFGGKGNEAVQVVGGYNKFRDFIINGGEFTKDVPGVPIFFTANYARDNSVFRTSFSTTN